MSKPSAFGVYLWIVGVSGFIGAMVWAVMPIYRVQTVGLDPFQLVFVGTVLEVTFFLFEVPTGIVADAYSRRLSVILAKCLLGVGVMLEGFLPFYGVILIMQVVQGIGYTFESGALDAWAADELGEDKLARAYLRAGQVGNGAGLVGTLVGVGLALLGLHVPIVLGGALTVGLGVALIVAMPERGFRPVPRSERNSWSLMGKTLQGAVRVVRKRHAAAILLAVGVVFGLYSEGLDRLWQAHFLENFHFPSLGEFKPILWFGVLSAGASLVSMAGSEWMIRRFESAHPFVLARRLLFLTALLVAGLVAFALAGNFFVAVMAYWVVCCARSMTEPLYRAWLNQNVDSHVRATVLSVSNQTDALGQFLGGPAIGVVGKVRGLRAAILTSALLLSPNLPLFGLAMRRRKETPLVPDEEPVSLDD